MSGTWYANRRAQGLCCGCGVQSEKARCDSCGKKNGDHTKARHAARAKAGLCIVCSTTRGESTRFCPKCAMRIRLYNRARMGCGAWVKGGKGRPPLS